MDPLPFVINIPTWPEEKDGMYLVNRETVLKFSGVLNQLITYIEHQQSKCMGELN